MAQRVFMALMPGMAIALACVTPAAAIAAQTGAAGIGPGPSTGSATSSEALKKMSVEELLELEVTSVSGSEESLRGAAAAIAVITRDAIRRSGASSLPEALRLVPGLHVARRDSSAWAVSSRGFSSVTSEKLLVLADTRSIYTPLFSGVSWDVQDFVLEDIERIEVIRGPGATLWGSNAVNGVINITTRSARDTQGLFIEAGGGDEDRAIAAARYGGRVGETMHYRVFGKYAERDGSFETSPERSDDWRIGHIGFRSDWAGSGRDSFTVQGDAYRANVGQLFPAVNIIGRPQPTGDLEAALSGGNLLARWVRDRGAGSTLQLRAYLDRTRRDDPSFLDTLDTFDLDVRVGSTPWPQHEWLWGVSYRFTSNSNRGRGIFAVEPEESDDQFLSAFVQDQIAVTDALRVTVGTKLEQSDFSDFDVQPSVRLAWETPKGDTLWASVSRALRAPTRLERDVAIDVTDPSADPVARLLGNPDFESEELVAYELGYRGAVGERLSFDLATFYNQYDGLASLEFADPFLDGQGRTIVPIVNQNLTDGYARGVEALLTFTPLPSWQVAAGYSFVEASVSSSGLDANRGEFKADSSPRHQVGLRSFLDLPHGIQFDLQLRYLSDVERLPEDVDGSNVDVDGYSELDVRLGWRANEQVEVALIGKSLLNDRHPEFGLAAARGEIERSIFGRLTCRF